MNKDLSEYNAMIDRNNEELILRKHNMPTGQGRFIPFLVKQFNIESIYDAIIQKFCFSEEILKKLSEKPIDIITLFYFLDNSHYFFHIGNALIVGNGELSIVDINTLSLLQGNHYKVYLISTLYEKYIDFFELIYFGKITYPKKNK